MMELYYVPQGWGALSRGIGIVKALGTGIILGPRRKPIDEEGMDYFGGLPRHGGVFLWDAVTRRNDVPGIHISIGDLGLEVDYVLDVQVPILSGQPTPKQLRAAEGWWDMAQSRIITVDGHQIREFHEGKQPRLLACRGGAFHEARQFERETRRANPDICVAVPGRSFFWPATALMMTADEVTGGGQSAREAKALRDKEFDGAAHVAGEIRAYLQRNGIAI